MRYNRQLMMAILHDQVQIAKAVNATAIPLDEAPQGYAEFDKGAARKYVLDPHGMVAVLPRVDCPLQPGEARRYRIGRRRVGSWCRVVAGPALRRPRRRAAISSGPGPLAAASQAAVVRCRWRPWH